MKKFALLGLALCLILSSGAWAGSRVVNGTYYSDEGDFGVKFWKEMFKGGGPGQPRNTLQALGQGFIFNQAVLQSVTVASETGPNGEPIYVTTYVGGKLTLNSKGPWLDSGILKDKNIVATNESYVDAITGELVFEITFSGTFDKAPGVSGTVDYTVTASYRGIPEVKYESTRPVFQRGTDFEVIIDINVVP